MSIDTRVELSSSCEIVLTEYESIFEPTLTLDYTEHSSDPWHSDNETSIDIDKDMAIEIILVLQKAYKLEVSK
tara:strand:- start:102 stop:320 length:219 start_codon:yes stop_codon:yes gene_type:complete